MGPTSLPVSTPAAPSSLPGDAEALREITERMLRTHLGLDKPSECPSFSAETPVATAPGGPFQALGGETALQTRSQAPLPGSLHGKPLPVGLHNPTQSVAKTVQTLASPAQGGKTSNKITKRSGSTVRPLSPAAPEFGPGPAVHPADTPYPAETRPLFVTEHEREHTARASVGSVPNPRHRGVPATAPIGAWSGESSQQDSDSDADAWAAQESTIVKNWRNSSAMRGLSFTSMEVGDASGAEPAMKVPPGSAACSLMEKEPASLDASVDTVAPAELNLDWAGPIGVAAGPVHSQKNRTRIAT